MLEVTAYTGLGPGIHDVNVTACSVKQAKAGGEYLRWEYTAADGKTASENTSKEMTPGNKTGKRFAALTGRPTEIGERRSLTEVIGKPATIVIEVNDEGYPKVIALTARSASVPHQEPASIAIAAEKAAEQHAIQEGDEPQTEIGLLP